MEAYVLINAESGMIWEVVEATLKIEGVKMAHAVTGQFDSVAILKKQSFSRLSHKIAWANAYL